MLYSKKSKFFVLVMVCLFSIGSNNQLLAQESILDVGIRFQKNINLYWENGVSVQYSHKKIKPDQLYFGLSYVSSRLGTAINSNAIKQDNILFSTSWYFKKDKLFRPVSRLNLGYFIADYEASIFDVLPNTSMLFSPEIGVVYASKKVPLKAMIGLGYNLVTGDGTKGGGTVYPLFTQTTVSWTIFKK
ncbi:hypothetical protein BC751_3323 [Cecembia calidifontis]|uniref:Outer membrane protein with beta-barrel domain n=2 Tax=Cecembia calidifontis TaxID=1187080 RepID=A0A4Q7PBW6_9BACT|nr:hypothetical protein BC751_3323 [Cecembia calidifontis]